ncbi:hypothetical protein ASPZODRAFT_2124407 [Penicilliopsis zonata CBS 506.65]|uniref:Nudix hydrolase domain-containing protein n=1 Tax=Penicilliopsis zonata CBS 506.65 TaxID=1073090 RepID=A0A1L9SMS1_9EURO|nr:hypothetical protein ASPZODRAFT_2124407 [Penicilliopsis zonata CBS 506.65]OJJ48559.1 hypothetical protein ASPZODRAFT_2124407 [Penicilliopsis zonata CBS 506.65]
MLSAESASAIERLRNYTPPPSTYTSIPLSRQAAVLILLYGDRQGDLRVVLTIRSKELRTYAGQAALPGGHAEPNESAFQTARREAEEEIGVPRTSLPPPFTIEHLCELPASLARAEVVVRPCVAWLHSSSSSSGEEDAASASASASDFLRLDRREVAAVFTAPFRNFLLLECPGGEDRQWYQGWWTRWHETDWRMHRFSVPINSQDSHTVFGLTARILVDAARVAYALEPQFEHNTPLGDEELIARLKRNGGLAQL